ncbi:MAG: tryptophan--tRNA ligase [Kiritimatiellia bacterium]|nr:tryptophan--tRNA ligase [Lentisphaerota bacterium]
MRILSGIQPSGRLHIGNYFGMMRPALDLQERGQAFLFIADYHAMTTITAADELRRASLDVALDFLACGLDPQRTVFYRQSDVPEVHELAWLLSTVTPVGLLERCHAYKDKLARGASASHALFAYPVLMAADILAVRADIVPVGQDQKQHLEVARDIAVKFNQRHGEVFHLPDPLIQEHVSVVPGLDGQKMSKSYNNTIEIFGAQKATRKTVMRIVTNSQGVEESKDPEKCNVFALYRLFADEARTQEMARRYRAGGLGYGEVKQALFELLWQHFEPYRRRREELAADPRRVETVLAEGAARAREEITRTLRDARRAVGVS